MVDAGSYLDVNKYQRRGSMKPRSIQSPGRHGQKLDLISLGEVIDFSRVAQHVPVDVLRKIGTLIAYFHGKQTAELTAEEKVFVETVVGLANENMVKQLIDGKYPNSLWTPELRRIFLIHQRRSFKSVTEIRSQEHKNRRKWLRALRDSIVPISFLIKEPI